MAASRLRRDVPYMEEQIREIVNQCISSYNKTIMPIVGLIILGSFLFCGSDDNKLKIARTSAKLFIAASLCLNMLAIIIRTILWILEETGSSTTL